MCIRKKGGDCMRNKKTRIFSHKRHRKINYDEKGEKNDN